MRDSQATLQTGLFNIRNGEDQRLTFSVLQNSAITWGYYNGSSTDLAFTFATIRSGVGGQRYAVKGEQNWLGMGNDYTNQDSLTIAVVGDIHDRWDRGDEIALKRLGVDLVLFVGDFGNESVDIVRAIAALDLPKAAICGNHDAWYTASDWGRSKSPYDHRVEDRVQQQLDLLGEAHVGYGKLDLPQLGLTVVGGRPFSWGGSTWKNHSFYRQRYGITNFAESTERIVEAARSAACPTLLVMGHCGPLGLGDRPEDPCGKDWEPIGGDHGDPDLAEAIAQIRQLGKTIPLVTFGHMHHQLRHTKAQLRRSVHVDEHGTVYLNAANVPRIVQTADDSLRNFSLVTLRNGSVFQAALVWLNQDFAIKSKYILHQEPFPEPEEITV